MGFDELRHPAETPGIERAAGARQGDRRGRQVRVMPEDMDAERGREGLDEHPPAGCRIGHLGVHRPGDVFDQGIAKAAVIVQADGIRIDIEIPKRRR